MIRNILKSKALIQQSCKLTPQAPASVFSTHSKFAQKLAEKRKQSSFQVSPNASMNQLVTSLGANQFIQRVYKATGLSIVGALSTAQFFISSGMVFNYSPMFLGLSGFAATLIGFIGCQYMVPTLISYREKGELIHKTSNSPLRLGLFGLGVFGLGLSSSPLFAMYSQINPSILPASCAISAAIFGSASLYAYLQPKDKLLNWGNSLRGALMGLIGIQITGLLAHLAMGPNLYTHICHRADTFVGLGIFTAFVAYDTHVALKSYEDGNADHLGVSTQFILDFWNILLRVAEVLRMFSSSD